MVDGKRKQMRQGQQNRRGRGRGRKVQNPLSRNYESSGPDVKIRGNAAHIAEKYATLARDALSSGDPITAENYLQHAEHYNRIIMAAQPQNGAAQNTDNANGADRQKAETGSGENGAATEAGGNADVPENKEAPATGNGAMLAEDDKETEKKPSAPKSKKSAPAPDSVETREADEGNQPPDNAAA